MYKLVPPTVKEVKCTMCDDTGYKDYYGFCMDECDCGEDESFVGLDCCYFEEETDECA